MAVGIATATREAALASLHEKMASRNIRGYWQPRAETAPLVAHLWPWREIQECVTEAGRLITIGHGGEAFRRASGLRHPALGGLQASPTLTMGVQLVNPGEHALAHRHTASALRFVIESDGGRTTSDGEVMPMDRGDLLIQPSWTWHDHANVGTMPVMWLDVLDVHMLRMFGANFREDFSEDTQPATRADDYAAEMYSNIRPPETPNVNPPYRYRWGDTEAALRAGAQNNVANDYDGVILSYRNPVTGGSTLRTMDCRIQMLAPGQETREHRHTGTTLYHVFSGHGTTVVEADTPLVWEDRDCFMLPTWQWHRHRNASTDQPAILFSVTDEPVVKLLNLYREERR